MGTDRAIEGGDGWCIKAGVGLVLVHLNAVYGDGYDDSVSSGSAARKSERHSSQQGSYR